MRLSLSYDISQCNKRPSSPAGGAILRVISTIGITLNSGHVSAWADISGQSHNPVQVTPGFQPLLNGSGGPLGGPCVTYDGVDDLLQIAFTLPQPCHVFIVSKHLVDGTAGTVFDGATSNAMRFARGSTNVQKFSFAGGAQVFGSSTPLAWHVNDVVFNGASSSWSEDGVQKGSGNAGSTSGAGVTFGSMGGGGFDWGNISMTEALIYPTILTGADLAQTLLYLKATNGTP